MKRRYRKIMAMLLALLMCVQMFVACDPKANENPAEETLDPATRLQQELTQQYQAALDAWIENDVKMKISYERTVTVAGQTYSESGKVDLRYWNQGTEEFLAQAEQKITYGDDAYETEIEDIYSNGKFYETVSEDQFYGELTTEEFLARQTPLQMLDPALYTLSRTDSGIAFTNATAVEGWLAPEEATVTSCTAQVVLDDDGVLDETEYTVSYQLGAALIELAYDVGYSKAGKKPTVPEDTADYVLVDDMMAVYALEHAYGYLSQARHVSAHESNLVMSVAAGLMVLQNGQVDAYAVEDQYAMQSELDISMTDYTTNQEDEYNSVQTYKDGKYTFSEDGGESEEIPLVSQSIIEQSVTDQLLNMLPQPHTIAATEVTPLGSVIYIEYTGTEEMGEDQCAEISKMLFGDGDVLNKLATAYETKEMTYYLGLDAYTLLPTAFGMKYEGTHTIEGQVCMLSRQLDKSYDLACLDTYDTIFEELAPETEPEKKATPLLYKVTGADGQQMWLMGTIHIGDSRTAYLPQAVYDAFDSSDALAVECDIKAFEEKMDEDEETAEQLADYYFYSDGTQTKDHIETPDLYEDAVKMMKATGNYNFNTEYLQVALWGDSIDQFYKQQSYSLESKKGVDYRLLTRAGEQNKPILEVESVQFQMQMTANYSDHLQEVQLYSAMCGNTQEYGDQIMELYEAWCAGDEQTLTELLNEEESWQFKEEDFDLTELTGEELERAEAVLKDLDNINAQLEKLKAEYDKAMSSDRNKGMIEVAKSYLESDQTVFFAVGLAHLLAEDGLVNGLRAAGYTVELVTYS